MPFFLCVFVHSVSAVLPVRNGSGQRCDTFFSRPIDSRLKRSEGADARAARGIPCIGGWKTCPRYEIAVFTDGFAPGTVLNHLENTVRNTKNHNEAHRGGEEPRWATGEEEPRAWSRKSRAQGRRNQSKISSRRPRPDFFFLRRSSSSHSPESRL